MGKNEDLLPLDGSKPVALFGGGADKTVKGGTGSGFKSKLWMFLKLT